jgi:predicted amidophosphoribosyltransferase
MGQIFPTSRLVHDPETKKNIVCYFAGRYYSTSWGPDEYSKYVYLSKDTNQSEKFWPQMEGTFLYARKMENDSFDYSCLIPGHDRPHNETCFVMQERIKQIYGIEPQNRLRKTSGCKKSYTLRAAERFPEMKAHAEVDAAISVEEKSVLLIDDLLSTGAHISAYGSLLYKCGAKNVAAIVIAENVLR